MKIDDKTLKERRKQDNEDVKRQYRLHTSGKKEVKTMSFHTNMRRRPNPFGQVTLETCVKCGHSGIIDYSDHTHCRKCSDIQWKE